MWVWDFPTPHTRVCEEIAVGMIVVGKRWKRRKVGGGGWKKRMGIRKRKSRRKGLEEEVGKSE